MGWRLAESLKTLRTQINALYPNRSKVSDGSIGDDLHAARASDHNPNSKDVVCAIDITHDPKNGVDCHKLADVLDQVEDKRINYVIWNGRILKSRTEFKWEKYTGKNKHNHHLHISVKQDASLYDIATLWNLNGLKDSPAVQPEPDENEVHNVESPIVPPNTATGEQHTEQTTVTETKQETVQTDGTTSVIQTVKETAQTVNNILIVLKKENPALYTKIMTGFLTLASIALSFMQDRFGLIIAGLMIVCAGLLWHFSSERAQQRNIEKMKIAADKDKNTVDLVQK